MHQSNRQRNARRRGNPRGWTALSPLASSAADHHPWWKSGPRCERHGQSPDTTTELKFAYRIRRLGPCTIRPARSTRVDPLVDLAGTPGHRPTRDLVCRRELARRHELVDRRTGQARQAQNRGHPKQRLLFHDTTLEGDPCGTSASRHSMLAWRLRIRIHRAGREGTGRHSTLAHGPRSAPRQHRRIVNKTPSKGNMHFLTRRASVA